MAVTVKKFNGFNIHTYASPEDGGVANTVIIETAEHLIVMDTQMVIPFAKEARAIAEQIGKPIERVIVSHSHPDHWLAASVFQDVKIYAVDDVKAEISAMAAGVVAAYKPTLGDMIPDVATVPTEVLPLGDFKLDGVTFHVEKVKDTECSTITMISIPQEKVLLSSDIIYNQAYLYIAELHFSGWRSQLEKLKGTDYTYIVPGHGAPTEDASVIDRLISELTETEKILSESDSFETYKNRILERYPDHIGHALLGFNETYLKFD